jgi:putative protease
LFFQRGHIQFGKLKAGDRVWKTDDPTLNKRLQQSYAGTHTPRKRTPIRLRVSGRAGSALVVEAFSTEGVPLGRAESQTALQQARNAPLTPEHLTGHLGRFSDAPYQLSGLEAQFDGPVILPISELNRVRRSLVETLESQARPARVEKSERWQSLLTLDAPLTPAPSTPRLTVLCRTTAQLLAAVETGAERVYLDFEDVRRYKDALEQARSLPGRTQLWLATPRIQKAGEQGFFRLIENALPDGVLIRNLGALEFFSRLRSEVPLGLAGDFSLNVANPLSAREFLGRGLETVAVSYDLTLEQVLDLAAGMPPEWLGGVELTLHQHMPMFHMEHCVFAAFMSNGRSFLDCGRPCEKHRVHLRDRIGMEHPLRADAGCRNTLFNAVPQTGAQFFEALMAAGLRTFRLELLEEEGPEAVRLIIAYQELLRGQRAGAALWKEFRAHSQLGVTRGTLAGRDE